MRSILGIILIIGGLILGYFGYDKLQNNKADIKIGELEISAKDKGNTNNAWVMIAGGGVALIAGAVLLAKKSN